MAAIIRAILDILLPQALTHRPVINRCMWILFAIAFFQSGMAFTTLALEPESFRGGSDWLWAILFPMLIPAFFIVNRRLGCGTAPCWTKAGGQMPATTKPNHEARLPRWGKAPSEADRPWSSFLQRHTLS